MHPYHDNNTENYDIALMKLEAPVDFEAYPHIRPVRIEFHRGWIFHMITFKFFRFVCQSLHVVVILA